MFRRLKRDEKGQSLIEFALVIPIILLIALGTIQFSYMLNSYILLSGLARDGARVGSYTNDDDAVKTYLNDNTQSLDPAKLTITIIPDETTGRKSGDPITVKLEYPLQLVLPMFSDMVGGKNLTSAMTMRVE